jgi:glycosyltransferase involved in cell wall biosynthesis
MATVSVIIPTFNRARKVVRAVTSVLSQTYADLEVIVVDDASTDDTANALAPFRGKIATFAHGSNRGVSAARNTGIRKSSGPLIAFLDSDDYWLPEKAALQAAFFERHPQADICQTEEIWVRKGRRVNPQKKHVKPSGDIFEASLKRCLVSPSSVMLKRSLVEEVGPFDEDLPACEDYDLWLRISCRHPVHLIREHLVVKEGGHPDQLSSRYRGMDRFRIKALLKLLKSGTLNQRQLKVVLEELSVKCRIYGEGCLRRGKKEEGAYYLGLPESMKR